MIKSYWAFCPSSRMIICTTWFLKNNVYIKMFGKHLLNTHQSWHNKSSLCNTGYKTVDFDLSRQELGCVRRWISWQLRTSTLKRFHKIEKPLEYAQEHLFDLYQITHLITSNEADVELQFRWRWSRSHYSGLCCTFVIVTWELNPDAGACLVWFYYTSLLG